MFVPIIDTESPIQVYSSTSPSNFVECKSDQHHTTIYTLSMIPFLIADYTKPACEIIRHQGLIDYC